MSLLDDRSESELNMANEVWFGVEGRLPEDPRTVYEYGFITGRPSVAAFLEGPNLGHLVDWLLEHFVEWHGEPSGRMVVVGVIRPAVRVLTP